MACREGGGEAGGKGQRRDLVKLLGLLPWWRPPRKTQGGLSTTDRPPTNSTRMARREPDLYGVAQPTDSESMIGRLDDTTDGRTGGGRQNPPTKGAGNGRRTDGVGEEGSGDPPTTRGDMPRTPGEEQGTHTDQGGG